VCHIHIFFEWSSYPDYIGDRKIHEWLNRDFILGYFGNKVPAAEKEYKNFVSGLEGKEYESSLKEVFASTILGDRGFIEYVKKTLKPTRRFLRQRRLQKKLPWRISLKL